jgi:hypothetical protein
MSKIIRSLAAATCLSPIPVMPLPMLPTDHCTLAHVRI